MMKIKSIGMAVIVALGLAGPARGATISWSAATAATEGGVGEVLSAGLFDTNGAAVIAENVGGGATTFDGISFSAGTTVFEGGTFDGYHQDGQLLSETGTFGTNGASTVTLTGLTAGTNYVVQALVFDGRGSSPGRTVEFDGIDQGQYANGVSGVTWGTGLLVTGTFTADATSQAFTVETFTNSVSIGSQLNALTVFDPNGAPPPPPPNATISWSSAPAPVEGASGETLSAGLFATNGAVLYAENVGGDAVIFDYIAFTNGSTVFSGTYGGFHEGGGGSQLSSTGTYGSDGAADTVTLSGLTSGTVYQVQALLFDNREAGVPVRNAEFDGIDQGNYANGAGGDGLLATGDFTAVAPNQTFTIEAFNSGASKGGQLNALTLIDPAGTFVPVEPPLPPEPIPNMLTNGTFELNVVTGQQLHDIDTASPGIPGWTMFGSDVGHSIAQFESNWNFWGALPGLTNGQYISLNAADGPFGDAVEQTFETPVGSEIEITYLVGNGSFSTLESAIQLDITSEGGAQGDLGSYSNYHGSANGFTQFTNTFTATTANTTLRFTDVSTGTSISADTLLDQVIATLISEAPPVTLTISGPISGGTAMEISWESTLGINYALQTNDNLVTAGWATAANVLGNGGTTTVTNTITGDETFYRVITE